MKSIVTDIDHTISDAHWRDPLIGNWDEYYRQGDYDKPIIFTREILFHFSNGGVRVVVITGRPEEWRGHTLSWLLRHNFQVDEILMRGTTDRRPSPIVKKDLITKRFPDLSDVIMVLEDRDDCVKMYREMGLNVLQVNYQSNIVYPKPMYSLEADECKREL